MSGSLAGQEASQWLSRHTIENSHSYAGEFLGAEPFRHVVIDGFFAPDFAERLLAEFPTFDPALAKNEIYKGVWGKAVNTRIREIAPAYRELYELIGSEAFLGLMGEITGISGLVFDPALYGGGTHENLNGQDLDPHVDFNYDEAQRLHRRLNLIVYLNKDWRAEWGGAIELHSNPRKPEENRTKAYNVIFNRAVLFETNEHSWHGFPRIELPPAERHRSRKSVSIYLYTKQRPADEIAPLHGTFYVQRPLPGWVRPGHVLSEEECRELRAGADRRDKWIEFYQRMELTKSAQIQEHTAYLQEILSRVHAPLVGYITQEGGSEGLYGDGWTKQRVALQIRPLQPVAALRVRGWRPDFAPQEALVTVRINGHVCAEQTAGHGVFEVPVAGAFPVADAFRIEIECEPAFCPPGDGRPLAFVLMEIRAQHG